MGLRSNSRIGGVENTKCRDHKHQVVGMEHPRLASRGLLRSQRIYTRPRKRSFALGECQPHNSKGVTYSIMTWLWPYGLHDHAWIHNKKAPRSRAFQIFFLSAWGAKTSRERPQIKIIRTLATSELITPTNICTYAIREGASHSHKRARTSTK